MQPGALRGNDLRASPGEISLPAGALSLNRRPALKLQRMWPHLDFSLFGSEVHLHTYTSMIALYAIFGMVAFTLSFRKERRTFQALALSMTVAVAAFFGARLFHLLVEKPIAEFSIDQLTTFDGMTFYGSLIAGLLVTLILTPILFRKSEFAKIADLAGIFTALGYGFLRIGCFANGCCWGSLTAVPWAVRYRESDVMPALGLPVHPVQLYDSAVGFAIAAGLFYLHRSPRFAREFKGLLLPIFLISYSIGRIATEFFRGDGYRGENVFLIFSTSQTISIGFIALGTLALVLLTKKQETPK